MAARILLSRRVEQARPIARSDQKAAHANKGLGVFTQMLGLAIELAQVVVLQAKTRLIHIVPHPEFHTVFEALGYALGFAAYRRARAKSGDVIGEQQRWSVIAAAAIGALLGSRILGLLEEHPGEHVGLVQFVTPGGGKTIVGGLLGGWLAVEVVKRFTGIRTRTGDLFAIPLCIGIAVGRVGCLLAGLVDDTYGSATSLPWAVDFGDGIGRHPTQAYEILFLTALGWVLHHFRLRAHRTGATFRVFLAAYLGWRLMIDFLKPDPALGGLNLLQWACLGALLILGGSHLLRTHNGQSTA